MARWRVSCCGTAVFSGCVRVRLCDCVTVMLQLVLVGVLVCGVVWRIVCCVGSMVCLCVFVSVCSYVSSVFVSVFVCICLCCASCKRVGRSETKNETRRDEGCVAARAKKMRRPGIEPGASRWQRDILPLNQRRFTNTYPQQVQTHRHTQHDKLNALNNTHTTPYTWQPTTTYDSPRIQTATTNNNSHTTQSDTTTNSTRNHVSRSLVLFLSRLRRSLSLSLALRSLFSVVRSFVFLSFFRSFVLSLFRSVDSIQWFCIAFSPSIVTALSVYVYGCVSTCASVFVCVVESAPHLRSL